MVFLPADKSPKSSEGTSLVAIDKDKQIQALEEELEESRQRKQDEASKSSIGSSLLKFLHLK